jgi:hypothetical protein
VEFKLQAKYVKPVACEPHDLRKACVFFNLLARTPMTVMVVVMADFSKNKP